MVSFIAECNSSIHTIGIELSRAIADFVGREALLAEARSEILQSIGARDIVVSPKAAHFAVTGIWRYDSASVAALAAALEAQRDAYRTGKRAMPTSPQTRLGQLLRKKKSRVNSCWEKKPKAIEPKELAPFCPRSRRSASVNVE